MKKYTGMIMKVAVLLVLATFESGCVSGFAINSGYNRACEKAVLASGDVDAIKSMRMGGSPRKLVRGVVLNGARGPVPGVGIDISPGFMQGVKEAGWWLVPSVITDAGIAYGLKWAYDEVTDDSSGDGTTDRDHDIESGRDTVVVNGDGNDVYVNTSSGEE